MKSEHEQIMELINELSYTLTAVQNDMFKEILQRLSKLSLSWYNHYIQYKDSAMFESYVSKLMAILIAEGYFDRNCNECDYKKECNRSNMGKTKFCKWIIMKEVRLEVEERLDNSYKRCNKDFLR